ncbi:MAG: hypothetical protein ACW981_20080 [Candidatus Hodarchaeales archaeon]
MLNKPPENHSLRILAQPGILTSPSFFLSPGKLKVANSADGTSH